jgi:DNA-binding MarR family transcriptional regulator
MKALAPEVQLAQELLTLWTHMLRGSVGRSLGLLDELGLGLHQVKTLDALDACDCDCEPTVKELGDRLGLSLPGMSRNVEGLLQAGYLERREDPQDRRMKRLRLTDSGRDAIDRLNAARLEGLEAFTASLPRDQAERLAAALAPITRGLRR